MSLLRIETAPTSPLGPVKPHVETTADVILAIESGANALRRRAQKLADNPDADEAAEGVIASWFEDARLLDELAAELHA